MLYGAWASFVATALIASYAIDPYVFGFVTLALAAPTAVIALVGVIASARSTAASARSRALIMLSLAAAAAAIAVALAVLRGIRWA